MVQGVGWVAPFTFLLSPHISRGPNAKNSFARPQFRSSRTGTLATQSTIIGNHVISLTELSSITSPELIVIVAFANSYGVIRKKVLFAFCLPSHRGKKIALLINAIHIEAILC